MKSRWVEIFWSVVMIAAGVVFMLREMGVIALEDIPDSTMGVVFVVLSIFFFITYFLKGIRNWGWLFPAFILAALGLILLTEGTPLGETLSGAPVLYAVALPFLAAVALQPKENWWALIPALIMLVIGSIILFEDRIEGDIIGTLVLYSIALPFLFVFLLDHSKRWALIPFAALAVIGLIPLMDTLVNEDLMGSLVMFLFALPFFVFYISSIKNWWALIPAGVFTSIGAVTLLTTSNLFNVQLNSSDSFPTAILLAGFGLTFGVLWLRRSTQPTDWAKYPAIGCLVVAAIAMLGGRNFGYLWPVGLIIAGVVILVLSFIKKPAATSPEEKENKK